MTTPIPAWVVGATGALIILVATAIGVISDRIIQSKLGKKQEVLSELEKKVGNAWDHLKLADARVAQSVNSVGLYLVAKSEPQFYFPNAAQNLRGAILSLYISSDKNVPSQAPKEIAMLEQKLANGDVQALGKLNEIIDSLRLDTMRSINEIAEDRRSIEQEIMELESAKSLWGKIFVGLNMFGLAIVLLKDLPIWRAES